MDQLTKELHILAPKVKMKPLHILARNIGRQVRFGGNTDDYWWSVLHHSFVVERIVSDVLVESKILIRDAARLYALIHDLHEGDTGDILTPCKAPAVREFQEGRDMAIYAALCIPPPGNRFKQIIKRADLRAMWAEAAVLDDPYCWLDPDYEGGMTDTSVKYAYDGAPNVAQLQRRDQAHVRLLLAMYGSHTLTTSIYSRAVQDFVRDVVVGVQNCKRLRVDWRGPLPYYLLQTASVPTTPPFIPNPEPLLEDEEVRVA